MEHGMADTGDTAPRRLTSFEIDEDLRKWLDRKVAARIIEDRPKEERTIGAIIREALRDARERDEQIALAS